MKFNFSSNNKKSLFAIIPGMIALITGVFILAFIIIKWLWAWTIPDLFPGAVDQGLIAKEISWLTSFKLALFIAFITGMNNNKT